MIRTSLSQTVLPPHPPTQRRVECEQLLLSRGGGGDNNGCVVESDNGQREFEGLFADNNGRRRRGMEIPMNCEI